ncbi:MAG: hypothetical protein JWM41_2966 [Gemmatimonadetes bacterium]|nr:hypothetical protein [Gemmatimonadota bacterium]
MLAYLAVRGRARRDELISILWGEIPEEKARNAFRQSLHRLRTVLGEEVLPQDREHVAIAGDGLVRIDRDSFLAACDSGRWDEAVEAYAGEFLEGLELGEPAFDRWSDSERVRLRARFQQALLAAGGAAASDGRARDALRFAERLAAVAPYDEEAAIFEANTLVAAGRPAQALTSALQFAARLHDELDVEMPAAIRSLIDRLQKRRKQESTTPQSAERVNGTGSSSFVGRDAELSKMLQAFTSLRAERGATTLVEGSSGLGKSRLLDEFTERARNLGNVLLFRGREAAGGGGLPYIAIAEALRPIVRAPGISGASRHLLAEAARLLPELRDSFELPAVAPIEDATGRLGFFEGIAALIDAVAYERPVCLIIDDAQHASASTLDLLTYLSRRLHQSPVMLVIAYRTERSASQVVERLRALVVAEDGAPDMRIVLEPLSVDEAASIVREALRGSHHESLIDVDRIARATNGFPFAAIDLARRAAAGDAPTDTPAPLRDILWARLQAATSSQRRVFFAASLFERSASLRLLAAAAHLPESAALEAAEALTRAGLLRTVGDGFVLAHDCALSFLVETSGLAGRALLASWAADALRAENTRTDAELAALYALAARGSEAFVHARAGAFAAAAVGAAAEVARLLSIALTFAPEERARREIESLLTAFGRGQLALPGTTTAPVDEPPDVPDTRNAADAIDLPEDVAAEAEVPDPPRQPSAATPARRSRVRVATRQQWLMSIAVSVIIVAIGIVARRGLAARAATRVVSDTLVLVERGVRGQTALQSLPGASRGPSPLQPPPPDMPGPAWLDSLPSAWTAPLLSPTKQHVAVERVTSHGQSLFVISADRRDTIPVAVAAGDNVAMGWSPDGRALLFTSTRTLDDGSLDSDLFVKWIGTNSAPIPLDTSSARAVTEAQWSPDGASISWVARSAASRQRDVYVSRADGTDTRNVTSSAADDYHASWSADGRFLAFTSSRGGGSRVYVQDLVDGRLWTVSDRGDEDHATFSPDGRTLAFESARDGDLAVYTRPSLGGDVRRLTPAGRQFSIAAWRGPRQGYVDRLRIIGGSSLALGDTALLTLLNLQVDGAALPARSVRWSVLDPKIVQPADPTNKPSSSLHVVGRAPGNASVIASIPGWRADTVALAVSTTQSITIADSFSAPRIDSRWLPLGEPLPYVARAPGTMSPALYPNGDLEWESGVLLRSSVQLRAGLRTGARLFAPFTGRPAAATFAIALVPATAEAQLNPRVPRFAPLIAIQWDAASGNFVYSVGQQTFSDRATSLGNDASHLLELSIGDDRSVTFFVDGQARWRSSLTFLGDVSAAAAQVWLGGRATFATIAVTDFRLQLAARNSR